MFVLLLILSLCIPHSHVHDEPTLIVSIPLTMSAARFNIPFDVMSRFHCVQAFPTVCTNVCFIAQVNRLTACVILFLPSVHIIVIPLSFSPSLLVDSILVWSLCQVQEECRYVRMQFGVYPM